MTVLGALTFAQSYEATLNNGTIEARGDIAYQTTTGSITGTAVVRIDGTGDQTFTSMTTIRTLGLPVTIDKPSGTLTLVGTINLSKDFTHIAGTIDPGTSTVVFGSVQTITGSMSLYNVTFNPGHCYMTTLEANTVFTVSGTLTLSGDGCSSLNGGMLEVKGDIAGGMVGTVALLVNGTEDQDVITGSVNMRFPVTIDKPSGTLSLLSAVTFGNTTAARALTVTAGTLDMNGNSLTLGSGGLQIDSGGTLKNTGSGGTLSLAGNVTNNGTVSMKGNNTCGGGDVVTVTSSNTTKRVWSGTGTAFFADTTLNYQQFGTTKYLYSSTETNNTNVDATTYASLCPSTGTYTSAVSDAQTHNGYTTATYTHTALPNETFRVDIGAGDTASVDGTWTWVTDVSSGGSIAALGTKRYYAYRVITSAAMDISVTIGYSRYATGQTLASSPFDAGSDANILGNISWNETTPANTSIGIALRAGADATAIASASWSAALTSSSTGCSKVGTLVTCSVASSPILQAYQSGTGTRWFQYKVLLDTADGLGTPTFSDITMSYIVNAAPEVQNVTASQGVDGSVSISYEVRDIDATTGTNTPNFITPTFKYWNGSSWVTAATMTSGTGNKAVTEGAFTTYTATWNAPADFNNQYFANTVKIRVTANDNEGANNTTSADSVPFVFDTKAPTASSVTVDATTAPATLHLSSSDDSALQVMYSLDSAFAGASWESFAATKTLTLATDPDTVYVKYKDAYGNTSAAVNTTTPETPTRVMVQDTSNLLMDIPEYRLFVAWKTINAPTPGFNRYDVYRATDTGAFSVFNTVPSRLTNYYGDNATIFDTTMRYQIASVDSAGNKSYLSSIVSGKADGIQGAGEGGGGSSGLDTTPPAISAVGSSNLDTTQVTIVWDTDEASYSTVGFSETQGIFTREVGTASLANDASGLGRHSVVLTGLTPNTTYYYRVKSADNAGNPSVDDNGGPGYSFTTNPGPSITFGALSNVGDNGATVSWTTSIQATASLKYATSIVSGALVDPTVLGPRASGTSHTQTLSGLSENTTYYFSLHAEDASHNEATDDNGGSFYSFVTTHDQADPVISSIATPILTADSALITWNTDEPATAQVRYATTSGGPYTDTPVSATYDAAHAVVLSNLSANTPYYFKVVSEDMSGNVSSSSEQTFTGGLDPSMAHEPLSSITDISDPPTFLSDVKAVITFKTDQSALCYVEYGTKTGDYDATPVSETLYNREHAIHLTGLTLSTPYFYRIDCTDNTYHLVVSDEKTFTTLEKQVASGSEVGDVTAPSISSVSVGSVTGESAVVSWTTDEAANSFVAYGLTNAFGKMSGDYAVNSDVTKYSTSHSVTLTDLIPGATTYHLAVLSTDASGNVGQSSEQTFSTKDAASISSIRSFSQKIGEVTVAWKTSAKTSSTVEYGLTQSYTDKKESSSSSTDHELTLSGLTANTTYHFRVKGKDADGNIFASDDLTFEPKSPPTIANVKAETLSEREAKVTFTSNVPTDALIVYQGIDDAQETGSQGDPTLSQTHSVILKNLKPGTKYRAIVKAQDEVGNASEHSEETFETKKDDSAPVINQIRTDVALTQNNKVQALISWNTDELAVSSIMWREGQFGNPTELAISKDASQNHIGVITSFKPGGVYYFKAKVTDVFGNEATSKDYMVLTPRRTENIVEIIMGNFKDIFSWAK